MDILHRNRINPTIVCQAHQNTRIMTLGNVYGKDLEELSVLTNVIVDVDEIFEYFSFLSKDIQGSLRE